jgi:hypothetical protein
MKKYFLMVLFSSLLLFVVGSGLRASAFDLFSNSCNGDKASTGKENAVCTSSHKARSSGPNDNVVLNTIHAAITIIAAVAGLMAVLMIIIAGFTYVTSGGNAEQAKNARNRIIYAAVGLAIIAASWSIINFITGAVLK